MKISREDRGGVVILRLEGKLLGKSEPYDAAIEQAIREGMTNVIADLGGVSVMNSTGLGVLTSSFILLNRHAGTLKLLNATKRIEDVLMTTMLATVFESFGSEDEAIASFA